MMRYGILILLVISVTILVVSSGCKRKIPSTPDVLIPESTYTGVKTTFRVSAIDPNNDAVYYIMDWGDGVMDTFPETGQEPYLSGDTVSVFHTYEKWSPPRIPEFKNFAIKATAKDAKGNIQKYWSEPETIKVTYNEEPNRPIVIGINDTGGIYVPQGFGVTATDPEGDSIAFQFSFFEPDSWTKFIASGDTLFPDNDTTAVFHFWSEPGTKGIWVIAKDIKGSLSIPSDTIEFEALDEGYVKGIFQATTRPDQGEVDTVGMQSSPALAAIGGTEKIFIGSEGSYAYIINTLNMNKEISVLPPVPWWVESWGNSPAVDFTNGRWYMANDEGNFYCLSSDELLWRYPNITGCEWNFTDAAFNGNYVYVATPDTLYCLNGSSGSKLWSYSIPGIVIKTAPIIDVQGDVYIGDDSGYVRKINGTTGEPIWQHDLGDMVPTSGAIDNITGTAYFGVNNVTSSHLCALEPDSGVLQWSYPIDNAIINSPVIGTDGYIYIGDDQGKLYAVKDGSLKSGFPISLSASFSTPAFAADGYFYLNTDDQRVFCININGRVRWETQLSITGSKRYRKLREDFVPSPVIGSDGDIYVAAGEDEIGLYRLKGRSTGTPANTPWPMFRHDRNHSGKAGFVPSRSH